jgi:transglutaminase-like putative cysteine protease
MDTLELKRQRPISPPLTHEHARLLWLAALVNGLFISLSLPWWVSALMGGILVWRASQIWLNAEVPGRWILISVIIGSASLIALLVPQGFSVEAMSMIAPVLACVKQLETRTRRDAFVAVMLLFFMVLASFLFSQTMTTALLALLGVWLSMAALANLHGEGQSSWRSIRLVGVLIAQALPFVVVLFVLFPRNLMPLWTLPPSASRAETGLKDTLSPGSISELSLSGETAFRVRFTQAMPPIQQLYWRGPVMVNFDGRTWSSPAVLPAPMPDISSEKAAIEYEITLEPHNNKWMLALDLPVSIPSSGFLSQYHQLVSRSLVRSRIRYSLHSVLFASADPNLPPHRLLPNLQLPSSGNPRSRQLARSLRETHPKDEDLIKQALAYFKQNNFSYTLQPALLGQQPIDDFLFRTREGFCEHFASSFVFLMRAAGIPARVVTGYQGGELNPIDGYLVVRQADAHAWAEVWVAGKGWQRVDPTATVSPMRVLAGLATALPAGETVPFTLRRDIEWVRSTRHRLDALTNGWNQWVLGYSTQSQRILLARLGLYSPDWKSLALASSILVAVFMLLLVLWAVRPQRQKNRVLRAWHRVCRKLAARGLAYRHWEGALDYAARVERQRPDLRDQIYAIAELYTELRYGPPLGPHTQRKTKLLETLIQRFKP